jgi:hypothetical protein
VNADDLDRTYALLSQAMTRVQTSDMELFLARLALLLLRASDDPGAVARAIADAEADLPLAGREDSYAG